MEREDDTQRMAPANTGTNAMHTNAGERHSSRDDIATDGVEGRVGSEGVTEATAVQDAETTRRIAHERVEADGVGGQS